MSRLDKTLADYIAIAISPALIMLMVGSLMWFLVAVLYEGQYSGRILWILACYVFAIVLITRVAIEEGQERAMLLGVALVIAVGLATMRFSDSMILQWILLGLAWWAAHKLTMDCTLIDEEQDSTGQGLLQLVGFGKKPAEADQGNGQTPAEKEEKEKKEEPAEPEGVTERVSRMREEAHPKRQTKGKGHAPGVWIVYFSLAALPLFGLGQMLVPVSDEARRLWTFQLLATYVAAGLGLLVTTSFLGLRRYLRQRGVQMPPQMAGVWIVLGAAIIVTLLAVCAILPRPAAEYEVARMPDFPLKFSSPKHESNRLAMGKEGADENSPDSQSRTQGEQDGTKPEGGESDDPESGGSKGSNAKEGKGNKKSSDGKPQGGSKGEKQGQSESKQDSSSEQQQQNSKQNDSDQDQSDNRQPDGKQGESSNENSQRPSERENSSEQPENSERAPSSEDRSERESEDSRRSDDERSQSENRSDESQDSGQREERQEEEEGEEDERSERTGAASSGSESQKPSSPPFQMPQVSFSGGLFGMLKFLLYLVIACVAAWWLWKNWSRVVAGFLLFLQELRDLWARLFGGKPRGADGETDEEKPAAKPARPFADYADPFSAGLTGRYAPDELVRYTFEATEAWACENGCDREPDQTPHEFAARIGGQVGSLRPGAVALAKLYCQAAYAPGSLAPQALKPLADFWRRLRASHGTAPEAPPVQTPVG